MLIAAELGLAAGVIAGSATAAYLAAALMATFAATMVAAILRGRAGAPCACFGARSTVGWAAVARNVVARRRLRGAAVAARSERLSTDEWLGLGLAVALLACAGLAVAVLALAREVGMLRLRLGPGGGARDRRGGPAAVQPHEPDLALSRSIPRPSLALAVFVSEGCHVCRALEPSIRVARQRPARRGRELRGGAPRPRSGPSSRSRAARSRSRSTARAPCSPRAPSTTSPSSRACSRRPSGAGPSATLAGAVGV